MLQYINALIQKIKSSEKGQGMVEYALIIAVVAAIAIFVLSDDGLGGAIGSAFTNESTMIESANEAATSIGN